MFVDPSNYLELDPPATRRESSDRAGEPMSAPPRELAQRLSGGDEVLLLWYPAWKRVKPSNRELATCSPF